MIPALKTHKHGLIFTQVTIIDQHNLMKPIKKKKKNFLILFISNTLKNHSQYRQEKISEPL